MFSLKLLNLQHTITSSVMYAKGQRIWFEIIQN